MKRNALWLLVAVMAMGLIAAGCGDDDDGGDDGGEALSKEEYLAQGNAICKEGDAEINAAFEQAFGNSQPTPEQIESVVTETMIPNIQAQIDDLREGIPEGDEDQVNEMLDEAELALQDVTEDPSLATGDQDPFADVSAQLDEYGLTACGSSG
jgi:hypothetical protein